ncbi:MAG: prepilin-type N-terminal cleavage/methylation domain-containing protein [Deltaproteobacteria bacterium]|nr:prepilin-type N-terminal cleavage/methylation domain-containing protein [Deltaproteobacteria bacterium]
MEKIKANQGFTLLEVIFAVSILTVGILAVAAMQASSIRGNAFAWGTSEATNIAMAQIENLMDLPYNDDLLEDLDEVSHSGGSVGNYDISWTVEDDAIIDQTKTVDVTVAWTDHGASRNVVMSFVIGHVI